jgi:hypothetical protein
MSAPVSLNVVTMMRHVLAPAPRGRRRRRWTKSAVIAAAGAQLFDDERFVVAVH